MMMALLAMLVLLCVRYLLVWNPNAWTFLKVKGHQGPLTRTHPDYKGSTYNVLVH
jgi:hypothetical protein